MTTPNRYRIQPYLFAANLHHTRQRGKRRAYFFRIGSSHNRLHLAGDQRKQRIAARRIKLAPLIVEQQNGVLAQSFRDKLNLCHLKRQN